MAQFITTYQAWNQGLITGFGSFHTTLLQAYRIADEGNRRKLEKAFPDWFLKQTFEVKQEPQEERNQVTIKTAHGERVVEMTEEIEESFREWFLHSDSVLQKVTPDGIRYSTQERQWKDSMTRYEALIFFIQNYID
jgi:hypothetical protein